MTFNMKTLLLLALSMVSMVAGRRTPLQSSRKLSDGAGDDISLTRMKGKDSNPDEVDLDVVLKTCKKDSDECDAIVGEDEAKEVSLEKFVRSMADDMVGALDEDENDRRNLQDRELYTCYYYYYCGYYYCYYRYICV